MSDDGLKQNDDEEDSDEEDEDDALAKENRKKLGIRSPKTYTTFEDRHPPCSLKKKVKHYNHFVNFTIT